MLNLNIKPTHKPIKSFYAELKEYDSIGAAHEGAVRTVFQNFIQHYCRQADLILVFEKTHYTSENRRIIPDGEVVDAFCLPYEILGIKRVSGQPLYSIGYRSSPQATPLKIAFIQSPTHALLNQHGQLQLDLDIAEPRNLYQRCPDLLRISGRRGISAWHTAFSRVQGDCPGTWRKIDSVNRN